MNMIVFLIQHTMFFAIPLLIVALGGMFAEKAGIINIALEGKMVLGAFSGVLTLHLFQDVVSPPWLLIAALLVAILTGIIVAGFFGLATIKLGSNQVISGVAINMLAPALAIYLARVVIDTQHITFNNQFRIEHVPVLGDIPILGALFFQNSYSTTYFGIVILIISGWTVNKTRFGLHLRACGENPEAAESAGVKVDKTRFLAVMVAGVFSSLGGIIFIIPAATSFSGTVSGYGFLALAVLVFGAWKPFNILLASLAFGLLSAIAASHTMIDLLPSLPFSAHIYRMMPYLATLVILIFTSKKTIAPKALGNHRH